MPKLRDLFRELNISTGSPKHPSKSDAKVLEGLEQAKISDPLNPAHNVIQLQPLISGSRPKKIVVEVRKKVSTTAITYWYYWDHDRFPGDHIDWEPVTLLYSGDELSAIYSRVHDGLAEFAPVSDVNQQTIFFPDYGHTPIVKVLDETADFDVIPMGDGADMLRRAWVELCYNRANSNGWTIQPPIQLDDANPPALDNANWKTWGKHAVYCRF